MSPNRPGTRPAALLLTLVLAGCSDLTAPSEGVTLYAHDNYGGDHYNLVADVAILRSLGDSPDCKHSFLDHGWNDCASSIRVAEGWQAIVYEHTGFNGDSLIVTSDIPDLDSRGSGSRSCVDPIDLDVLELVRNTWDDCISSIRVLPSGRLAPDG